MSNKNFNKGKKMHQNNGDNKTQERAFSSKNQIKEDSTMLRAEAEHRENENTSREQQPKSKKDFSKKKPEDSGILDLEMLKKTGIFTAVVVVLFGLLVGFSLLANGFWNNGLRNKVQAVLDQNNIACTAGAQLELNTALSTSCAVYALEGEGVAPGSKYGIIVRETTMYGPLAAVFLYDVNQRKCSFVNYADVQGFILDTIVNTTRNSQIQYWENRIPFILDTMIASPEHNLEG